MSRGAPLNPSTNRPLNEHYGSAQQAVSASHSQQARVQANNEYVLAPQHESKALAHGALWGYPQSPALPTPDNYGELVQQAFENGPQKVFQP